MSKKIQTDSHSATLGELATLTGAELRGSADVIIECVAPLQSAAKGAISFLANPRYRRLLADTQAEAVILPASAAGDYRGSLLISENPYLTFAQVAKRLNPVRAAVPGVHPSAVVDATACIAATAEVGPHACIGAHAVIGEQVVIGAGTIVGARVMIADGTRLSPNVTVLDDCQIGERVVLHSGVVIGADGFGFAKDGEQWVDVPQLGRVIIGNDVSVGANTTIDRGSQEDTNIEQGVKIDNLVQIAHNVRIGAHTAIAAGTGISGSTKIGRCCTIAGQVGFAGHLEISDHCTFTGKAMVIGSVHEPGVYSSGIPAMPWRDWRRTAVRVRQLDRLVRRIEQLEQRLGKEDIDE